MSLSAWVLMIVVTVVLGAFGRQLYRRWRDNQPSSSATYYQ